MTRRTFLTFIALGSAISLFSKKAAAVSTPGLRKAMFWRKTDEKK